MTSTSRILLLALLTAGAATAAAAELNKEDDPFIVTSESFLAGHPDMLWRSRGVLKYQDHRYREAVSDFRDAARYADKPSQAMLAMMLWNGDGVDVDRVQAYAWIDIASERGYPAFVATRDKFWAALNDDERRRALELGRELREKYGDEHARSRQSLTMTRAKIGTTGSHLGYAGNLDVRLLGPDGRTRRFSGSEFYASRYWSPKEYWAWQDLIWAPSQGEVDVGPVQPTDEVPEERR